MGIFNKLTTMGALPPGYKIDYKVIGSKIEYKIYFKGQYTGFSTYDEGIAIRKVKDMAKNK